MNAPQSLPPAATADAVTIVQSLADEAATEALAHRLAPVAVPGDVIALWGDLGAGKTVFARAFVRARSHPAEEVPSPTFTLLQTYPPGPQAEGTVYHFDLFRLEDADEALELGLEEALAEGVSLIEWPDRLGALLPAERLDVVLDFVPGRDDQRRATLRAGGTWSERLAELDLG